MDNTVNLYFDAIDSIIEGQDKARENLTDIQRQSRMLIDGFIGEMTYDIIPVKQDPELMKKRTNKLKADLENLNYKIKDIASDFYTAEKKIKKVREVSDKMTMGARNIVSSLSGDIHRLCDSVEENDKKTTEATETLINSILNETPANSRDFEALANKVADIGDNLKTAEMVMVRDISRNMYEGSLSRVIGRKDVKFMLGKTIEKPVRESERYRE